MRAPYLMLVLGLVGCTSGPADDGSDEDATEDDTPDLTDDGNDTEDSGTDTEDDEVPASEACAGETENVLQGTLMGTNGQPIDDMQIKFCNQFGCRVNDTDAEGGFCYTEVEPEAYSFVPVPDEGSGLAHAFSAFTMEEGQVRTVEMVIPTLDEESALESTPKELELGSGLLVTVGKADLEVPDPFYPEAESAAGVAVSQLIWPPLEGLPGTPVAVWYTEPYDYNAPNGLSFRIKNDLAVPVGETRELWVGSYSDFAWLQVGTLTAGDDGYLAGNGVELELLSTLVLVEPE